MLAKVLHEFFNLSPNQAGAAQWAGVDNKCLAFAKDSRTPELGIL
jgi:hypothetical protein